MNNISQLAIRVIIMAALTFIRSNALAERPAIQHVELNSDSAWKTFATELADDVIGKATSIEAASKLTSIGDVEPVLLGVVLLPGAPIDEFGASVTEFVLVTFQGKDSSGGVVRCVSLLSRSPYSNRKWEFNEIVSGVHVNPPQSSLFTFTGIGNESLGFMKFVSKIFEPGICFGAREKVIDLVVFDAKLTSLIGRSPEDQEWTKMVLTDHGGKNATKKDSASRNGQGPAKR